MFVLWIASRFLNKELKMTENRATRIARLVDEVIDLQLANRIREAIVDGYTYQQITIKFNLPREDMIPTIRTKYKFGDCVYWHDSRVEQLIEYFNEGLPYAAIALKFPNSSLGKVRRQVGKLGLSRYNTHVMWTPERLEELETMFHSGVTHQKMSEFYDISKDKIRYQLYKRGLKRDIKSAT